MKIVDLLKKASFKHNELITNVNFFVSYILFKILLNGNDYIPEVGEISLDVEQGIVYINLDKKWKRLLKGNCEQELVKYLEKQVFNLHKKIGGRIN